MNTTALILANEYLPIIYIDTHTRVRIYIYI